MRNLMTDVPGLTVGQAADTSLVTGATVVVFDAPARVAVCVLGGASAGRDLAPLDPAATVQRIDAVVLSGGSAFGLDAAGGVQAVLRREGRGLDVRGVRVPLVAQAVLFDLREGAGWGLHGPYRELGVMAAERRGGVLALGSVGAGTGATTATLKGGVGSASVVTPEGYVVAAIVAVNALGSATIGDGPWFWAAPFEQGAEFGGRGWPRAIPPEALAMRDKGATVPGTTIGLVATDAPLSKAQAQRVAIMAHGGLARAVLPSHLPMDGDTMFAASTAAGDAPAAAAAVAAVGHAAALVTARAIARGVFEATSWPGWPQAWRDRFDAAP